MKNLVQTFPDSTVVVLTNNVGRSGSGAAGVLASGQIVKIGGSGAIFAIAVLAAAIGATYSANTVGCYLVPKATGVSYAVGQKLGYDFGNDRVTTDLTAGVVGEVTLAAANGDTSVELALNGIVGQGSQREAFEGYRTNVTGNQDFDVGFPVATAMILADCRQSDGTVRAVTNVIRNPGGSSPNVVRLTISSLATGDVISIRVVRTASA